MYQFDHIGVPTTSFREGLTYIPEFDLWTSDYEKSEFRIEWIYFEKGCTLHPLIQEKPHVAFIVKDLDKAIQGRKILLEPCYYEGFYMVFIDDDGCPVEFIQPPK